MSVEKPNFLEKHLTAIIVATLAALVIVIYFQTYQFEYLNLDDNVYVTENAVVLSGINGSSIKWAFTQFAAANWHPLTWLSLALDVQIFGRSAGASHLVNVFLHLVCTILAFFVFRKMTGRVWESAVIAALFAVHPAHVESVAWITERKDVLSTAFWFLSMWFYIGWCQNENKPSSKLFIGALVAFALGLMSKPMVITLPFVLLLMDIWPLGRANLLHYKENWKLVTEKIPFFVLSLLSAVITVSVQSAGAAIQTLEQLPVGLRFQNTIVAYTKYIFMMFWPVDLAVWYPYDKQLGMVMTIGSAALLLVVTALCVSQLKDRKYLLVGWLWYVGTLVPVIGLVQVGAQSMADRYTYVPYFGLFIMMVFGVAEIAKVNANRLKAAAAACIVAILALTVTAYRQTQYWYNHEIIYTRTLSVTNGNFLVAQNLCMVYWEQKRLGEAERLCQQSLDANPKYSLALNTMGMIRFSQANYTEAEKEFQTAVEISPGEVGFHANLATAQVMQGKVGEAESTLQTAASMIDPKAPPPTFLSALRSLAMSYYGQQNYQKAFENLSRVIALSPDDLEARRVLSSTLFRLGKFDEAAGQIDYVLSRKPRDPSALNQSGLILMAKGQNANAIRQFEAALAIEPNNEEIERNLQMAKSGGKL